VTTSVVDCHYSITGSGPPLFLIHGIDAAEDAWRFMLPKLSKHFSVVTYDLRGHGKSPVTHKSFTLDELVLDLERIREKTKFEKAHFAGHSLGGMIAPAYALKFPDHVISVGLLSTVAGRSEEDSKKVWNVINEMEKNGIEKTLQTLTTRWFTDEFIKKNPDLVERRLKQVVDTETSGPRQILQTEGFIAFCPWAPSYPFEFWICPKKHSTSFSKITQKEINDLSLILRATLGGLTKEVKDASFNLAFHLSPEKKNSRQIHWHIEVYPITGYWSGLERGYGVFLNTISPEKAAEALGAACRKELANLVGIE